MSKEVKNRKNRLNKPVYYSRIVHPINEAVGKKESYSKILNSTFFESLIFSERTYFMSTRLQELPQLIDFFGISGLEILIQKEILVIHYDALSIGSVGRLAFLKRTQERGPLPFGSFCLHSVKLAYWKDAVEKTFDKILCGLPYDKKALSKLKYTIFEKLQNYEGEQKRERELLGDIQDDIRNNAPYVKKFLLPQVLREHSFSNYDISKIEFLFEHIEKDDFKVVTNLRRELGINIEQEDKIIEKTALKISNIYMPLFESQTFNAIGELNEFTFNVYKKELEEKLPIINPTNDYEDITKILKLTAVPDFSNIDKVDVDKLLKLKASNEYKEFINWYKIKKESGWDCKEMSDHLNSLSSRLKGFVSIPEVKIAKDIIFLAAGMKLVGPLTSVALWGFDKYLMKYLNNSGPSLFINYELPALIRSSNTQYPWK